MNLLGMGALVRLKSGGPLMVAVEFPRNDPGMVICAWIAADGTPQRVGYPEIALDVFISEERLNAVETTRERVKAVIEERQSSKVN